jgi:hypothetical protein
MRRNRALKLAFLRPFPHFGAGKTTGVTHTLRDRILRPRISGSGKNFMDLLAELPGLGRNPFRSLFPCFRQASRWVTGTRNSRARNLSGLPLLSPRPPFPPSGVPVTLLNILLFKDFRYRNLFRYFLQVPVFGFNSLSHE